MLNGGMRKRFQHLIQQNLASGLIISFRPQFFSRLRHARAPFWNDNGRAYVYNKVRSLLAVFVAFEVLNHEDEKRGRRKTRQWIRRRDERGYFNNIVKELAIEDAAQYKDMPFSNEYWATSNRILLVNKSLVRIKLFLERKISPDNKPHTKLSCFATVFLSMVTMVTTS